MTHEGPVRPLVWLPLVLILAGCSSASRPIVVTRSEHVRSNASAEETEPVLAAAESGLRADLLAGEAAHRGGLRHAVLTGVQVDGVLATVDGCGTFYDYLIPERYAIFLTMVKREGGWSLDSWQVQTDGLHGPRQPCS